MNESVEDPYQVLGLKPDADAQAIRQTYLAAVKRFPPDKEPDRFHQIHRAYQMLEDPLVQARAIVRALEEAPSPAEAIQRAMLTPPRLPTRNLLALGNLSS